MQQFLPHPTIFWQLSHNLSQKPLQSMQNRLASVFISSKFLPGYMYYTKPAPVAAEGKAARKFQALTGNPISVIQQVASFPPRAHQPVQAARH